MVTPRVVWGMSWVDFGVDCERNYETYMFIAFQPKYSKNLYSLLRTSQSSKADRGKHRPENINHPIVTTRMGVYEAVSRKLYGTLHKNYASPRAICVGQLGHSCSIQGDAGVLYHNPYYVQKLH
jgi:hypothetical protein